MTPNQSTLAQGPNASPRTQAVGRLRSDSYPVHLRATGARTGASSAESSRREATASRRAGRRRTGRRRACFKAPFTRRACCTSPRCKQSRSPTAARRASAAKRSRHTRRGLRARRGNTTTQSRARRRSLAPSGRSRPTGRRRRPGDRRASFPSSAYWPKGSHTGGAATFATQNLSRASSGLQGETGCCSCNHYNIDSRRLATRRAPCCGRGSNTSQSVPVNISSGAGDSMSSSRIGRLLPRRQRNGRGSNGKVTDAAVARLLGSRIGAHASVDRH